MSSRKIAKVAEFEARLVKEIRHGRAVSRLELAKLLRLAPSTVGIYVDRLLDKGFLTESSADKPQQRGRPIQRLNLRAEAGCFVGAELEAETIHAACMNFAGQTLARHTIALPPRQSAEEVLVNLRTAIKEVMDRSPLPPLGIGIGVPGTVDAKKGIALDYRFIEGWRDFPIVQRLHQHFHLPILVENNARTAALANLLFDVGRASGDFVCLLIRSGVGAGIVINGALHHGHDFLAGEIGRIQLDGMLGEHGKSETVEDTASVLAITRFVQQELKRGAASVLQEHADDLTVHHIVDAAREGDNLARQAVQRAARSLGWLVHVLALVINPRAIVLTGPLNALGDWLRLEVQAALNTHATHARTKRPIILLSQLADEAGALGAASLAMDDWKPTHKK